MKKDYWKAVIRYGHVGYRNEVSVARFLAFEASTRIYDVIKEVNQMPGTKNNCIQSIYQITESEYEVGKEAEKENFYLQKLFDIGA